MNLLFALAAVQGAPATKPNVLFIVIDDLGFDDVGFRSHEINTPVIDSLAASGVVLDQYYVQDVCSPSRSVFMTGRYSMHNTIVDWIPPASAYGLPLNETTLAQKMQEAGYACHATGKWHLGFYKWGMTPTFRGFESFVGFYSGGEDYFKHNSGPAYDFRRDPTPNCGKGCSQVDWQDQGVYSTTVFSREAVRIVSDHDFTAKPLFLYLAFQGVHAPAQVPPSYVDPYNTSIADPKRRVFAGMLSAVDEGIGNTTAALKAMGVFDNTLIVFTADNGGPTTTGDGVGARNWPLRGGKHSVWEGGTRATGFLTGTALLTGARASHKASPVYSGLMHGADWFATISTVAGFELNGTLPLDSIDQWGAILGDFAGASGPRTKIVIGNSTNMCSWHASDPRNHANANPARDGSDLPAGFYVGASGSALACGFAIKEYDRDHHWKLIKGYGGGPDTWCNSSSSGAVCGKPTSGRMYSIDAGSEEGLWDVATATANGKCTISKGTCEPGNNDGDFPTKTLDPVAECCDACTAKANCAGFTLNSRTSPSVCWLKTSLFSNESYSGKECVSGSAGKGPFPPAPPGPPAPRPGPHPPPPPEPVSTCPNGWCLYDTASDPHEENEVSASNPEIVSIMQKELAQILSSYHEYVEDKSCPPHVYGNDSHVGQVWEPWC